MSVLESWFFEIASRFDAGTYLLWTRFQVLGWSVADLVILFAVLKVSDLARARECRRKIRFRYLLLLLSAALIPFAVLAEGSDQVFLWEAAVFGLQFAVLLFSVLVERKAVLALIRSHLARGRGAAD